MLTVDFGRLGLVAGERFLDVGAGGGRHALEAMLRGAHAVAVDLDAGEVAAAAALLRNWHGVVEPPVPPASAARASATSLPFRDSSFDRVVMSEVLEHVHDDVGALRELTRVVRPGGTVAVTVPRWLPETVNWALSPDYHAPVAVGGHVRIYRESVVRERLAAAGLRVVGRHHAHGLHTPYWWLKCAVGVNREDHPLVRAYRSVLVRQMTTNAPELALAERVLQPLVGKSLVLYAERA